MGRLILCVAAVFVGVGQLDAAVLYSVTDLGDLPGGNDFSVARRINAVAQVVGTSHTASGPRAFLWSEGEMTDLGVLENSHSRSAATDINDAGQVAGTSLIDGDFPSQRPFVYSDGTMMNLGSFGGDYGFAMGINNAGQAVGLSSYSNGITHAFLWSNGSMIDLGNLGDPYSCAYDINNNGQVVGNSASNGADRGFIWENGVMTDLGDLPGGAETTRAYAVNDAGQVVGESAVPSATVGHAFLWQEGAMIDLGVLPGTESSLAMGLNEYGQVVGRSYNSGTGDWRAFIWDSVSEMQDLNDMLDSSGTGWTLHEASDINQARQVVGYGTTPSGAQHAFLLTPVPEPSTFALLGMGAVALLAHAWRRRR